MARVADTTERIIANPKSDHAQRIQGNFVIDDLQMVSTERDKLGDGSEAKPVLSVSFVACRGTWNSRSTGR